MSIVGYTKNAFKNCTQLLYFRNYKQDLIELSWTLAVKKIIPKFDLLPFIFSCFQKQGWDCCNLSSLGYPKAGCEPKLLKTHSGNVVLFFFNAEDCSKLVRLEKVFHNASDNDSSWNINTNILSNVQYSNEQQTSGDSPVTVTPIEKLLQGEIFATISQIGTEYVYFMTGNGHIHQIYRTALSSTWVHEDLHKTCGAIVADTSYNPNNHSNHNTNLKKLSHLEQEMSAHEERRKIFLSHIETTKSGYSHANSSLDQVRKKFQKKKRFKDIDLFLNSHTFKFKKKAKSSFI